MSTNLSRSLDLSENASGHSTFLKVPGIMGCFQALEVLKIASGQGCILSSPPCTCTTFVPAALCVAFEQDFLLIHMEKRGRIATLGWRGYFVVVWLKYNESKAK